MVKLDKIKRILSWHTRKSLSLRDKWWHRLFLLAYVFFALFLFGALFNSGDWNILDYPQYKMTSILEDRIDSELNTLADLANTNERIEDVGATSYDFKVSKSEDLFNRDFSSNIYCSTNINHHIQTVISNKKIEHFYIKGKEVLFEKFITNMKGENISCVLIDSYSDINGTNMYFLRTDKDLYFGSGFGESLGFYEISSPKTVLFVILDLIFILFITLVISYFISILYHKIALYVIFGKEKD